MTVKLLQAVQRALASRWMSIDLDANRSPEAVEIRGLLCAAVDAAGHKGWPNRATHAVWLHVSNDANLYRATRARATALSVQHGDATLSAALAGELQMTITRRADDDSHTDLATDLINAALADVDWSAIAARVLAEVAS